MRRDAFGKGIRPAPALRVRRLPQVGFAAAKRRLILESAFAQKNRPPAIGSPFVAADGHCRFFAEAPEDHNAAVRGKIPVDICILKWYVNRKEREGFV